MLWNKLDFYPALVKHPDAVERLVGKIAGLQFAFLDEWYRRYGTDFIAHFPEYYMPFGVTLSVDEIGAVSPKMFPQYFLPHLEQFSGRYGGLGLHCCANARHQWENLKKVPGVRLLNLVNQGGMVRGSLSVLCHPLRPVALRPVAQPARAARAAAGDPRLRPCRFRYTGGDERRRPAGRGAVGTVQRVICEWLKPAVNTPESSFPRRLPRSLCGVRQPQPRGFGRAELNPEGSNIFP